MRFCIKESEIDESIHQVVSGPYDSQNQCTEGCGDGINPGVAETCPGEKEPILFRAPSVYGMSLSRDSQSVVMGDWSSGVGGRGEVRTYDWFGDSWSLTHSMQGDEKSYFGWSVAISQNGSEIAVGAKDQNWTDLIQTAPVGYGRGSVKVYEKVAGSWVQKGPSVSGVEDHDHFGHEVKLSTDGLKFVSMSLPHPPGTLRPQPGKIRSFEYFSGNWVQKGQDLGPCRSLVANSDCSIVAFSDGSKIKVYEWSGSSWIQKGTDIIGPAPTTPGPRVDFALHLSMSDDGLTLATGSPNISEPEFESGIVRVYQWNPSSSNWGMKGDTIYSDANPNQYQDYNGWSVSLNADGNVLAAGAIWDGPGDLVQGGRTADFGQVRLFRWSEGSWNKICTATGSHISANFGRALGMDGTGTVIVASEPGTPSKVRTFVFPD